MQVLRCPFLRDQALRCENHRNKTDLHLIFAGDPTCFLPPRLVLHLEKQYTVHSIYIYIYHPFFSRDRPQCLRWWLGFGSMSRPHISLSMTGFEKCCVWNAFFGWPLSISFKRHPLNDVFTGRKALDEVAQIWRSQQKHRAVRKNQRWLEPFPAARLTYGFLGIAILGSFSCIGRGVSLAYSTGNCCFFVARSAESSEQWHVFILTTRRFSSQNKSLRREQVFFLYTCTSTRTCTSC